jgi:transposase
VSSERTFEGMPIAAVHPRATSRTCPACGSIHKANRRA